MSEARLTAYERAEKSCALATRKTKAKQQLAASMAASKTELAAKAALSPALFALGAGTDEQGFRRIGGHNTLRELNPAMQRRMQDVCFYLSVCTPFGEGIIRVLTDYVVGEGFQLVAEHPDLQVYLDTFSRDPVNNLAANLPQFWRELMIFGDQCLPAVENPVDGFVRLGTVDAGDIEAVEFGTLVTGNPALRPVSLPVNVKLVDLPGQPGARLRIAQTEKVMVSAREYDGTCFYFAINQVRAASRGISELFVLADWSDVFDQMIMDFADRVRFLNAFVWNYTLNGADDKKVNDYLAYLRKNPPKQGGFQVHNDSVKIETLTPDFKGADMSEVAKLMKAYGPGAKGLPPWFFGDPMDANRAANEVMEGPSGKMLTNKQGFFKRCVVSVADYAIDRAVARGTLLPSIPRAYKVVTPDISVKDMQKSSATLQSVGNSLGVAQDRGWIRAETAARAYHLALGQIGVEVDSQREFREAQTEKADRDAREQDALAEQAELARALEAERRPVQ